MMNARKLFIGLGAGVFALAVVGALAGTGHDSPAEQKEDAGMMCPGMRMMGPRGMMSPRRGMMGQGGMMGPGMGMMGRGGMMGPGMGMMGRGGMGMTHPGMGMMTIAPLLDSHKEIRRGVTLTETGVETATESDNPMVAKLIQTHAEGMTQLLKWGMPMRLWDPLFADLYAHREEIEWTVTPTEKGVRVVGKGATPEAIQLVQAVAAQMDRFVVKGWKEMFVAHPSPLREGR